MSASGSFLIYCIELYRRAKGMTGAAVYDLFHCTGADDYIRRSFGALHTTGERYVLSDIEGFLANKCGGGRPRFRVSDIPVAEKPDSGLDGQRRFLLQYRHEIFEPI